MSEKYKVKDQAKLYFITIAVSSKQGLLFQRPCVVARLVIYSIDSIAVSLASKLLFAEYNDGTEITSAPEEEVETIIRFIYRLE